VFKVKRDTADKYFSLFIRKRDGWKCQKCGKQFPKNAQNLHCSHFIGRRKEATRFNELNCDALCFSCHQFFETHQTEHEAWQRERKGDKVIDQLIIASNQYCKKDRKPIADYYRLKNKE